VSRKNAQRRWFTGGPKNAVVMKYKWGSFVGKTIKFTGLSLFNNIILLTLEYLA
jgi:hypothetical protein